MKCVSCDTESLRLIKSNTNTIRKVYVDGSGKQWAGNTCPSCRYAPKDTNIYSHRKCRKCHSKMTKDRYFECLKCKPELPLEDINEIVAFTPNTSRRNYVF